jgi:hypothetical protein
MNVFRNMISKITLIETGKVIPFPNQGVKSSQSQILDASPEELKQVISIAKIYENHKVLWFKNKKKLDHEIAIQALESLVKWAEYFDYDDVEVMIKILKDNILL